MKLVRDCSVHAAASELGRFVTERFCLEFWHGFIKCIASLACVVLVHPAIPVEIWSNAGRKLPELLEFAGRAPHA